MYISSKNKFLVRYFEILTKKIQTEPQNVTMLCRRFQLRQGQNLRHVTHSAAGNEVPLSDTAQKVVVVM